MHALNLASFKFGLLFHSICRSCLLYVHGKQEKISQPPPNIFFTRMQSIWIDLVAALPVCGWTAGRPGQKHFHFCERYQHGTRWDLVWLILVILVDMEKGEGSISPAWLASLFLPTSSQNKAWLLFSCLRKEGQPGPDDWLIGKNTSSEASAELCQGEYALG